MPAQPQKDKLSTTTCTEVLNSPATAAVELRKHKYKKICKHHATNAKNKETDHPPS
jgi:hypothetical protein